SAFAAAHLDFGFGLDLTKPLTGGQAFFIEVKEFVVSGTLVAEGADLSTTPPALGQQLAKAPFGTLNVMHSISVGFVDAAGQPRQHVTQDDLNAAAQSNGAMAALVKTSAHQIESDFSAPSWEESGPQNVKDAMGGQGLVRGFDTNIFSGAVQAIAVNPS